MADLMTRIGADDSQFASGMNRIDRRLTSFGRSVQSIGQTSRAAFSALGAGALAAKLIDVVQAARQIDEQLQANVGRLAEFESAGVRAAIAHAKALGGVRDAYQEIADSQAARQKAVAEEANRQIDEIGMMNPYQLLWREIQTGESMSGALDRLVKESNDAQNQVARASVREQKAQREKDAADDRKTLDARLEHARKVQDELQTIEDRRNDGRRKMSDTFADERVSALRSSGRDREAELDAARLRYQRMERDIRDAEYLSQPERDLASSAIAMRMNQEENTINARFAADAKSSARDGFQTVGVGGTTFGQQLALTMKDPLQAVVQNTSSTVDKLDEIARKLDRVEFGSAYR